MNPTGMNAAETREPEIADYQGCAILICSGDGAFLDYYRAMLLSLGFTPVTATTPEAAVAILRLMIVAYVVVDAENGLERCRQVVQRATETQHHAPVLVVSQEPDPDFRHQAMRMGATDCLDHPVLRENMVEALLPGHAHAKPPLH